MLVSTAGVAPLVEPLLRSAVERRLYRLTEFVQFDSTMMKAQV